MYGITISENLYHALEKQAQAAQRTVDDIAQETLSRHLASPIPVEDDLPPLLQMELQAMEKLSDVALWSLARTVMPSAERGELSALNLTAQERPLRASEQARQQTLLTLYDEVILRRAHAAMLLQVRGHDMSNTAVLQSE